MGWGLDNYDISQMVGRTILSITGGQNADDEGPVADSVPLTAPADRVDITLDDGSKIRMWHDQDCCETVNLADIDGDVADLLGSPLTMAEEVSNSEDPPGLDWTPDSYTWTFYKFATIKGYVTLRWFGSSNGYYSERVTCEHFPVEVA